jgi:DNA-binding NarL/FixJ family response regulator
MEVCVMQQKKILIIDDDIRYLVDAKRCLQSRGYAVSIHEYSAGSPVMIRNMKPDVVLLNIRMGDLSEEKLSYLLGANRHAQGVPVVFYSSHDEEGLRNAAVRHEAKGYIRKRDVSLLCEEVDAFCPIELRA